VHLSRVFPQDDSFVRLAADIRSKMQSTKAFLQKVAKGAEIRQNPVTVFPKRVRTVAASVSEWNPAQKETTNGHE
jgi:hypothetical protein